MSASTKPRLLLAISHLEWLDCELLGLLQASFEVQLRAVRGPERPRKRQVVITKPGLVASEFRFFLRLLMSPMMYRYRWRCVCFGGHYGALLFARFVNVFGRRQVTYLLNFYLHDLGRRSLIKRILAFLLTEDVYVIAQATSDAQYFRQFLPHENVAIVPYTQGHGRLAFSQAVAGDYVFSGGWTNRDFDAVLRCARRLPHIPFLIVPSASSSIIELIPPNVVVRPDLDPAEFERLLAKSRVVVIPLKRDVGSSGQMVLLAAMQFAKPVIAPRLGAIADFVADGKTALLYDLGDDDALLDAIGLAYGSPEVASRLGSAARAEYVTRFTPEHSRTPVVKILTDLRWPAAE